MQLLLVDNDTVPISGWRGGDVHSTERPIVANAYGGLLCAEQCHDLISYTAQMKCAAFTPNSSFL